MTDDNTDSMCLFFDEQGNGPSEIKLFKTDIRELSDGGEVISPRAFGLRWRTTGLLHFVKDGGFMLEARTVEWLRDQLTAWLDAPRLAARATAEVVASDAVFDDDPMNDPITTVTLLRTTFGEWGVRCTEPGKVDEDWFTAERDGRGHFADLRGKALCICGAECDEDEIDRSGGESMCPKCVIEAHKAFGALHFDCRRCGADLLGADLATRADSDPNSPWQCPRCNHFSVEEIDAMTEAAP